MLGRKSSRAGLRVYDFGQLGKSRPLSFSLIKSIRKHLRLLNAYISLKLGFRNLGLTIKCQQVSTVQGLSLESSRFAPPGIKNIQFLLIWWLKGLV